jgi:hypothetical protein
MLYIYIQKFNVIERKKIRNCTQGLGTAGSLPLRLYGVLLRTCCKPATSLSLACSQSLHRTPSWLLCSDSPGGHVMVTGGALTRRGETERAAAISTD